MLRIITRCFVFASLLACQLALGANLEAGKASSGNCIGCHGAKGVSSSAGFPNLAGQKADYLAAQLKAFRDKTRPSVIMGGMAAGLKDEDIANLAAYFASLKPCE